MLSEQVIKDLKESIAPYNEGDLPCEVFVMSPRGDFLDIINIYDYYPEDGAKIIIIEAAHKE